MHTLIRPRLFLTGDHPCNYLPPRRARNLVVEPERTDHAVYTRLIAHGFRRSGNHLYRPHCTGCQACQSLRIPVAEFTPDRAQRRVWRRNHDLLLRERRFTFDPEHYRLFDRYVRLRHPGGGMDDTTPEGYMAFLDSDWCDTRLWEFRLGDHLIGAAVVDHFTSALSAVYTYYEPTTAPRSPGTYAILRLIHEARERELNWLYLGYQIDGCERMSYKSRFRPHQRFVNETWRTTSAQRK